MPAIQAPESLPEFDVDKHKGHLTYAAATPAEGNKRWHAEGIVFSKDFPERVPSDEKQVGISHANTHPRA